MNEKKAQVAAARVVAEFAHNVNPDAQEDLRDRIAGLLLLAFEQGVETPAYDQGLRHGFER